MTCWEESFPKQQATATHSSIFVKKLLAVAVSNIAYLRVIFPEKAFGDRNLEDMTLKIIKKDKSCPGAAQMIDWLKGVFDALDKKYLKVLVFGIFTNPDDPSTFMEAYTFKFSYVNGTDMEIFSNDKKICSAVTADQTRKATLAMLRTLIVLMQDLKPLPPNFQVTMKLFYYDDVTPEDYEPPFFKAAYCDSVNFDVKPVKIRVGSVSTAFHSMKLRLTTDSTQFSQSEDDVSADLDNVAITTMQGLDVESDDNCNTKRNNAKENAVHSKNSNPVVDQIQEEKDKSVSGVPMCVSSGSPEDILVRCPCAANEDEGLMLQCNKCRSWQHAVCFRILDESEAPPSHVCNVCCELSSRTLQQTDASLKGLSDVELQITCLWRRTLLTCLELDELTANQLSTRLKIERNIASTLLDRLQREGYVKTRRPVKGRSNKQVKTLDKSKLTTEAMKKYFSIDPACEIRKMASQTSSVDFQETRQKKLHCVEQPIPAQIRPRRQEQIQTMASQGDEYHYEISNTQEDFEVQQPRRKRMKASMAQYPEQ